MLALLMFKEYIVDSDSNDLSDETSNTTCY
jgi:hypothetical protein